MTKFELILNRIKKIRFQLSQLVIAVWRSVADKIGIRRDPSSSLPISQETARVVVHGETAAEPHANAAYTDSAREIDRSSDWEPMAQPDIDFGRLDNLEAFAQEMTVPRETIERWVGAGILSPVEIRVAEQLIKIMREKDRKNSS